MISWYVRFAMGAHRTDRWQTVSFESGALRGNPLGDPHVRPLYVYVPPDASRRYPTVYVIQGMAGIADLWFNVEPWSQSYAERIEVLAPERGVLGPRRRHDRLPVRPRDGRARSRSVGALAAVRPGALGPRGAAPRDATVAAGDLDRRRSPRPVPPRPRRGRVPP